MEERCAKGDGDQSEKSYCLSSSRAINHYNRSSEKYLFLRHLYDQLRCKSHQHIRYLKTKDDILELSENQPSWKVWTPIIFSSPWWRCQGQGPYWQARSWSWSRPPCQTRLWLAAWIWDNRLGFRDDLNRLRLIVRVRIEMREYREDDIESGLLHNQARAGKLH